MMVKFEESRTAHLSTRGACFTSLFE